VEEPLNKPKREKEQYKWLKAADYYRKALTAVAESDFLKKGEIRENLAYAIYKADFQADSSLEFKERMTAAMTCYDEAKGIYGRSEDAKKAPRVSRCDATISFADYWIVPEPSQKKKRLEESWSLTREALDAFEDLAEYEEYGRTYHDLSRKESARS